MSGLRRDPAFARFWAATAISHLGTQVTALVLPLLALNLLGASTFQVGLLGMAEFAPFLLFGLIAGAVMDRSDHLRVMRWCDVLRAALLASIPLAWAIGHLGLAQVFGVVFLVGTASVFFDVGSQSVTPDLVARRDIRRANQALSVSDSIGLTGGPALGGLLVSVLSAPLAIVVDVSSYLSSFALLWSVQRPIKPSSGAQKVAPIGTQIAEGLAFVARHRTLRPIVACATVANLLSHVQQAVFVTYMVRSLHYSAAVVGSVFTFGNVGVLVGAVICNRLFAAMPLGQLLWVTPLVGGVGMLLIPLAPHSISAPVVGLGWLLAMGSSAVFNIAQLSYRQAATPDHLRARMNASVRTCMWGAIPIGYLLGGWFGSVLGVHRTLLVAGLLNLAPFALVRFSPAARLLAVPSDEELLPAE